MNKMSLQDTRRFVHDEQSQPCGFPRLRGSKIAVLYCRITLARTAPGEKHPCHGPGNEGARGMARSHPGDKQRMDSASRSRSPVGPHPLRGVRRVTAAGRNTGGQAPRKAAKARGEALGALAAVIRPLASQNAQKNVHFSEVGRLHEHHDHHQRPPGLPRPS